MVLSVLFYNEHADCCCCWSSLLYTVYPQGTSHLAVFMLVKGRLTLSVGHVRSYLATVVSVLWIYLLFDKLSGKTSHALSKQ